MKKELKLGFVSMSVALALTSGGLASASGIGAFTIKIPGTSVVATDKDSLLATINGWRKAAIDDDDFKFRTGLHKSYVPMTWSDILESSAKMRSAEASVLPDHLTLQGRYSQYSEVLAWNGSASLEGALNSWYNERNTYLKDKANYDDKSVNKTLRADDVKIGHYYTLVNPANTHIGLAGYKVDPSISSNPGGANNANDNWGAVAGEIMREEPTGTVISGPVSEQTFTVDPEAIHRMDTGNENQFTATNLKNTSPVVVGTENTAKVSATVDLGAEYAGKWKTTVPVVSDKWTSTQPDVITVSPDGSMTAKKEGNSTIGLDLGGGLSVSTDTKAINGKATADQMFPFLAPLKTAADDKLDDMQGFDDETRDSYKNKISTAESSAAIDAIVAEATAANAQKMRDIQALESLKNKAYMDIDKKFGPDLITNMSNPDYNRYQTEVQNATSAEQIQRVLDEMNGVKPVDKPETPKVETSKPDVTPGEVVPTSPDTHTTTGDENNKDEADKSEPNKDESTKDEPNQDKPNQDKAKTDETHKDDSKVPEVPKDTTPNPAPEKTKPSEVPTHTDKETVPKDDTHVTAPKDDSPVTVPEDKSHGAVPEDKSHGTAPEDKSHGTTPEDTPPVTVPKDDTHQNPPTGDEHPENPVDTEHKDQGPAHVEEHQGPGHEEEHQGPGHEEEHQGPGHVEEHQDQGHVEEHQGPGHVEEHQDQGHEEVHYNDDSSPADAGALDKVRAAMTAQLDGQAARDLINAKSVMAVSDRLAYVTSRRDHGLWAKIEGQHLSDGATEVYNDGAALGYDKALGKLTLGVVGAYGKGQLNSDWNSLPVKTKVKTAQVGTYGVYRTGQFYAGTLVGYQRDRLDGMGNVKTAIVAGDMGYTFTVNPKFSLTPQVGVGYLNSSQGDVDGHVGIRYMSMGLKMDYAPRAGLAFTSTVGMQRVRFGETSLTVPALLKDEYKAYVDGNGKIPVSAMYDTRFIASFGVHASVNPLFTVDGSLGYTKYKDAGLHGLNYGLSANYKF